MTQTMVQNKIGQTYTTGYLYDANTNKELFGVTVTLLDANWKPVGTPIVMAADSNTFSAWTYSPDTYRLSFEKQGYAPMVVLFSEVQQNPSQYMTPIASHAYLWLLLIGVPFLINRKKKVGAITAQDIQLVMLGVGGLIAFSVVKNVLEKFGLWKGQGSSNVTTAQNDPNSAWKPAYWQQFTSFTYAITQTQAQQYAETIHDAFGVFQDDYNAIRSVFNNLRTKANVSFLSQVFNNTYDEDLLSFLTNGGGILPWDGLSESHLAEITNYVNNLPSH